MSFEVGSGPAEEPREWATIGARAEFDPPQEKVIPPGALVKGSVSFMVSLGSMFQPRMILSKPQVKRLGLGSSDQAVEQTILFRNEK